MPELGNSHVPGHPVPPAGFSALSAIFDIPALCSACAHTTWQFVGSLGQQRCTPDVSHPCMMITRLLMSGTMSVVDQMGT